MATQKEGTRRMKREELGEFLDLARHYEVHELVSALGALQLFPENSFWRSNLERAARQAVEESDQFGDQQLTRTALVSLMPILMDDEDVAKARGYARFISRAYIPGGPFFFHEPWNRDVRHALSLLGRLVLFPAPGVLAHWQQGIVGCFGMVMQMTTSLTSCAGAKRPMLVDERETQEIVVPPDAELSVALQSVHLGKSVLEELLHRTPLHAEEFVCLRPNAAAFPVVNAKPIWVDGSSGIIIAPCRLVQAALRTSSRVGVDLGVTSALSDLARNLTMSDVKLSLSQLGMTPIDKAEGAAEDLLDDTLVVRATLDEEKTCTTVVADAAGSSIQERWQAVRSIESCPSDLLVLVEYNQGGESSTPLPFLGAQDGRLNLRITPEELHEVAVAEKGDPLALLKFGELVARRSSLPQVSGVFADVFSAYLEYQHSFYASDDGTTTLEEAVGQSVHGRLGHLCAESSDVHYVQGFGDRKQAMQIEYLYRSRDITIYTPVPAWQTPMLGPAFCVEIGGEYPTIWVHCNKNAITVGENQAWYPQVIQAGAYWVWMICKTLQRADIKVKSSPNVVSLEITLVPASEWQALVTVLDDEQRQTQEVPRIKVYATPETGEAFLALDVSLGRAISAIPYNNGEAVLADSLAKALWQLLQPVGNVRREDIVKGITSPKERRIIFLYDDSLKQRMADQSELPMRRKIQDYDVYVWIDEIHPEIIQELGLTVGRLPQELAVTTMHDLVDRCCQLLSEKVSSVDAAAFLPQAVAEQEAIVAEQQEMWQQSKTREACFYDSASYLDFVREQLVELNTSARASRFLLEYMSACPGKGARTYSTAYYDKLLSLSYLIVDYREKSDAIYYFGPEGKAGLDCLASGRFGFTPMSVGALLAPYLDRWASEELDRAVGDSAMTWDPGRSPTWASRTTSLIDKEMVTETGLSLLEIADAARALFDLAAGKWAQMTYDALCQEISTRLRWNSEKARKAIDLLKLSQIGDSSAFFKEKDTGRPERFNRERSYPRCPVLTYHSLDGKEWCVWGSRSVIQSCLFLHDLCLSGRLKCRSEEMKSLMGGILRERGHAFTDYVAAQLGSLGFLKIVKERQFDNGSGNDELGDVDIGAYDSQGHQLYVVECKAVAPARSSIEMADERDHVFGDGEDDRDAFMSKHAKRVQFVESHLPELLNRWFRVVDEEVKVSSMIVTSRALPISLVTSGPIPVMPLDRFLQVVQELRAL